MRDYQIYNTWYTTVYLNLLALRLWMLVNLKVVRFMVECEISLNDIPFTLLTKGPVC